MRWTRDDNPAAQACSTKKRPESTAQETDTATKDIETQPPPGIAISMEELLERDTEKPPELELMKCNRHDYHAKGIMDEHEVGCSYDDNWYC